jgi:hypothetical protein
MPTDSHKPLLDRDISKAAYAATIREASAALTEIVNYGTQLFARGNAVANDAYDRLAKADPHLPKNPAVGDFHLPIQFLYLHGLELVDAIQVMLAESVVTPAHMQLRGLFEAMLQLEWILREDTARRAFAYQLFDVRERLRFYRSLDSTTQGGKELIAAQKADTLASGMTLAQPVDLQKFIDSLNRLLTKPGYKEAVDEYDRMKKAGKQIPNWFALYDGPQKVQQLARKLGRPLQYEILYRHWSAAVHGAQVGRRVGKNNDIHRMRAGGTMADVVTHAMNFSLTIIQLYLKFYRPGEEEAFGKWYVQHIRQTLRPSATAAAPPK